MDTELFYMKKKKKYGHPDAAEPTHSLVKSVY